MAIKNLKLTNFRNIAHLDLDLDSVTLLTGQNAQGKSNILEAVYFLATTKSSRAEKDSQLVKQGEEFARAEGEVMESSAPIESGSVISSPREADHQTSDSLKADDLVLMTKLEIAMQRRASLDGEQLNGVEKRVKINGVPKRVIDYIGNLVAVHFAPEDLNLVTGTPSLRRWHIDLTLAQIDHRYKKILTEYHQALVSRNRILKSIKEGSAKLNELDFWTDLLVASGEMVAEKRRDFFRSLNGEVSPGEQGRARFVYLESGISAQRIREYLSREVAAAASLIGPHRDDFVFKLEGNDLAYFGSRGQQRTAVLELKLAELEFMEKTTGIEPILLLDDIFSELDDAHREYVVKVISGRQVIFSAVEESQIPEAFLKSAKVVRVEKGRIG